MLPLLCDEQISEFIRANCKLEIKVPTVDGDIVGHRKVKILQVLDLRCQTTGVQISHEQLSMHKLSFAE